MTDNALKGRRFDSLVEQNAFLKHWNRTIARLRIHGTTRRQVWTHFLETDQPALGPLAPEPFALFHCGRRLVHVDGHIEVDGSFYPTATHLLGREVQVRWDRHLVRIYHEDTLVGVHSRVAPGLFAPRPGDPETTSSQKAYVTRLLGRCERIGPELLSWATAAIDERGVRAIRLIQGALRLTRMHPRECVLKAADSAVESRLFRYRDLRRLTESLAEKTPPTRLIADHPSIRPLTQYRLEDLL